MTSNLDKLAAVVSPSARNTKAISISIPLVILDEVDRLSESLGLPRSAVLQALLRDALFFRESEPYAAKKRWIESMEIEHSRFATSDITCNEDDLSLFDLDKHGFLDASSTLQDIKDACDAEILEIRKRWSL